jgi:hypothetical protein
VDDPELPGDLEPAGDALRAGEADRSIGRHDHRVPNAGGGFPQAPLQDVLDAVAVRVAQSDADGSRVRAREAGSHGREGQRDERQEDGGEWLGPYGQNGPSPDAATDGVATGIRAPAVRSPTVGHGPCLNLRFSGKGGDTNTGRDEPGGEP